MVTLAHVVIEGADLKFVAPLLVALDSLVLVRVVKSLDGGVTLGTLEPGLAHVPGEASDERLAVLGRVLKYLGRSSEVPHMVCVNTRLGIVGIFFG